MFAMPAPSLPKTFLETARRKSALLNLSYSAASRLRISFKRLRSEPS
jgi:hypothetical protein